MTWTHGPAFFPRNGSKSAESSAAVSGLRLTSEAMCGQPSPGFWKISESYLEMFYVFFLTDFSWFFKFWHVGKEDTSSRFVLGDSNLPFSNIFWRPNSTSGFGSLICHEVISRFVSQISMWFFVVLMTKEEYQMLINYDKTEKDSTPHDGFTQIQGVHLSLWDGPEGIWCFSVDFSLTWMKPCRCFRV